MRRALGVGVSACALALATGVFLHLAFERYFWFMMAVTAAAIGVCGEYVTDARPFSPRTRARMSGGGVPA
jgi:hypothetical protein